MIRVGSFSFIHCYETILCCLGKKVGKQVNKGQGGGKGQTFREEFGMLLWKLLESLSHP